VIKGVIIEQVIGESIKIETADGSTFVFSMDQVVKIAKEKKTPAGEPVVEKQQSDEALAQLRTLIHNNAFRDSAGRDQMKRLVSQVTMNERSMLYVNNRKNDAGVSFGLNFLLYSLGSWIQGDYTAAIINDVILIAGAALMASGYTEYYDYYYGYYYTETNDLFYIGLGIVVGGWVSNLIAPFTFQKKWNNDLRLSLGLEVAVRPNHEYYSLAQVPTKLRLMNGDQNSSGLSVELNLLSVSY